MLRGGRRMNNICDFAEYKKRKKKKKMIKFFNEYKAFLVFLLFISIYTFLWVAVSLKAAFVFVALALVLPLIFKKNKRTTPFERIQLKKHP
jgi:1,4-dihydroxy-2-naphthoate octaprenyltransferase